MKKLRQIRSMFLLLTVAILVSTLGAQRAHADTVSDFTGTWSTGPFGYSVANPDESIGPIIFFQFDAAGLYTPFFFTNPVTDGTLQTCTGYPCYESYSGTFVGGTMSFYLDDPAPAFTAAITGGSYSGSQACLGYYPFCSISDSQTFTFTGQWENGWTSVGSFSGSFQQDGAVPNSGGTLTMTTTTAPAPVPEPGTITLLGLGMVLVAACLRLRLRNTSPVS
jgi:hypothetical protein